MSNQLLLRDRVGSYFKGLQDRICERLETLDDGVTFREDLWTREGGGGGRTRVIDPGGLFEKAGVNFSEVYGLLDEGFAKRLPLGDGAEFFATGTSLVLHPRSPMVPTVHANFRYLERGSSGWFGGGTDLTPYYPFIEDVRHFHLTLKQVCEQFGEGYYRKFKKWCDEYFYIRHRDEARGVGGLFFDYLTGLEGEGREGVATSGGLSGLEFVFELVRSIAESFLPAYLPIVERRRHEHYGKREREFQLIRRGRYAEFNLVYDRGTQFGLETRGRTESILMSLPPLVKWVYDYRPEPGSREAEAWDFFRARDWLNE